VIFINSVVFIHWIGDFNAGIDCNGYYCLPTNYYVYMPVRICNIVTLSIDSSQQNGSSDIATAGIQYDVRKAPTRYGAWNIPLYHLDKEYDQGHFLQTLLLTPKKFWPVGPQWLWIEQVRKEFDKFNSSAEIEPDR